MRPIALHLAAVNDSRPPLPAEVTVRAAVEAPPRKLQPSSWLLVLSLAVVILSGVCAGR